MVRFSVAIGTVAAMAALLANPMTATAQQAAGKAALKNPAGMTAQAPAKFKAAFETSAGNFTIEVTREWAPKGADRFYNLVKNGFFDECRFFRVVPGFMVQFGISGDPAIAAVWDGARITDDPVKQSNKRGFITFATAGANTRTTQLFISYADNNFLDSQGFAPFGKVVDGMGAVDKIYSGSGEKPNQGMIKNQGNAYLAKEFPKLDYIKKATIVE